MIYSTFGVRVNNVCYVELAELMRFWAGKRLYPCLITCQHLCVWESKVYRLVKVGSGRAR